MSGLARRLILTIPVWLLLVGAAATGTELETYPVRAPRPWVGEAPWAGFRLPDRGVPFGPPLAGAADDHRWTGWIAASAAGPALRPVAPVPAPVSPASGPQGFAGRETSAFREAWTRALAAAARNDAPGTRAALEGVEARTVEGEAAVRRLEFALAVSGNDRTAADSLFYRLSWRDGGRTATRLAAWRALEHGEGSRAAASLEGRSDPTPGERAALALARWMADPSRSDGAVPAGEFPPLAAQAVALAQAHAAVLRGDAVEARRALDALDVSRLPVSWARVRDALAGLLSAKGETGDEESRGYEEAVAAFLAGDDADALGRLDLWLSAWPESPRRPQAYLMRGMLRLAAGRLDEAAEDLAVAQSRGDAAVVRRTALAGVFLKARRGEDAEAVASFERIFDGPLGARAEAELLADRIRLAHLLGDEETAHRIGMRLEEAFPDSPWLVRSRADDRPQDWGQPYRVRPPDPPRSESMPELPAEGPWGPLLFGGDVLARAAERLERIEPPVDEPTAATPAPPPAGAPRSNPELPVVFAGVGGGGPAAFLSEGALGRVSGPVRYRAGFSRMLAGRRNGLPETDRFSWDGAFGVRPGRWRIDLTGRGDGRDDDAASSLGLIDREMDTDWRGVRFDLGYRGAGGSRFDLFASRSRGEVDAGPNSVTRTDRTWFGTELEIRRGDARWDGHGYAAAMDQTMPGFEDFRFWFRDVRLVRRDPDGWYLGVRASMYKRRGLLMPAAGVEKPLGGRWTAWVATEPSMQLPPFRETFVVNGDWQVPDLRLPAERRNFDLRGGLKWRVASAEARLRGELYHASHLRRWRRDGGVWRETAVGDGEGSRLSLEAEGSPAPFTIAAAVTWQRIESGGHRLPYTPKWITSLELDYRRRGWRWGISAEGVDGRTDENGNEYGSYLRVDLETAYRWRTGDLPLGARWLELWVRVENLGDVDDPRWPGIPGPGAGVYGGVQAVYGD